MEPEGVYFHLLGDSQASSLWHLSNAERALTLCGIEIVFGASRMAWASTPVNLRCEVCTQFGEH
jgi:hypothetical protein